MIGAPQLMLTQGGQVPGGMPGASPFQPPMYR
jgi:hypothetical protein